MAKAKFSPMSDMLRGELQSAMSVARSIDPAGVADEFYKWGDGEIGEDPVTRQPIGLKKLEEFRKARPELFKPDEPLAPTARNKGVQIVVDEDRDRYVPIGVAGYTFRKGQILADPYMIALANEHGIALREK